MERLRNRRAEGLSGSVIRAWGLVFLLVGTLGRAVQQSNLLGMQGLSMEERMAAMEANPQLTIPSLTTYFSMKRQMRVSAL